MDEPRYIVVYRGREPAGNNRPKLSFQEQGWFLEVKVLKGQITNNKL